METRFPPFDHFAFHPGGRGLCGGHRSGARRSEFRSEFVQVDAAIPAGAAGYLRGEPL